MHVIVHPSMHVRPGQELQLPLLLLLSYTYSIPSSLFHYSCKFGRSVGVQKRKEKNIKTSSTPCSSSVCESNRCHRLRTSPRCNVLNHVTSPGMKYYTNADTHNPTGHQKQLLTTLSL